MVSARALMLLCRSRGNMGTSRGWLGAEISKYLTSDVAFEAAYDFGSGLSLGGASADVVQCRLVTAHTGDDYPIEGSIGLPIASSVEGDAGWSCRLMPGLGMPRTAWRMLPPNGCAQGCRRQAAASRPQCPRPFRAPPAVRARGRLSGFPGERRAA